MCVLMNNWHQPEWCLEFSVLKKSMIDDDGIIQEFVWKATNNEYITFQYSTMS